MYEDLNMLRTIAGKEAIGKAVRHLGEKLPSEMTLIDKSASRTSGVGARYQQLLSSVAYGQLQRLPDS
jgi:hypothetical protein